MDGVVIKTEEESDDSQPDFLNGVPTSNLDSSRSEKSTDLINFSTLLQVKIEEVPERDPLELRSDQNPTVIGTKVVRLSVPPVVDAHLGTVEMRPPILTYSRKRNSKNSHLADQSHPEFASKLHAAGFVPYSRKKPHIEAGYPEIEKIRTDEPAFVNRDELEQVVFEALANSINQLPVISELQYGDDLERRLDIAKEKLRKATIAIERLQEALSSTQKDTSTANSSQISSGVPTTAGVTLGGNQAAVHRAMALMTNPNSKVKIITAKSFKAPVGRGNGELAAVGVDSLSVLEETKSSRVMNRVLTASELPFLSQERETSSDIDLVDDFTDSISLTSLDEDLKPPERISGAIIPASFSRSTVMNALENKNVPISQAVGGIMMTKVRSRLTSILAATGKVVGSAGESAPIADFTSLDLFDSDLTPESVVETELVEPIMVSFPKIVSENSARRRRLMAQLEDIERRRRQREQKRKQRARKKALLASLEGKNQQAAGREDGDEAKPKKRGRKKMQSGASLSSDGSSLGISSPEVPLPEAAITSAKRQRFQS
ncbi:unnamed protein product [Notodromas monacha]|uniref:Uncharacterized protein n=1 Tax=Notodromas monacha TaxID=399045 RepID=A0A7R9BIK3_9CRUS|nr:unnamed protein product [Notodromas monacha]CAG0914592.1 unnamed protein product [Notodromas monacha]